MHPSSNNIGARFTSKLALDNVTFGAGASAPAQTAGNAINRGIVRPLHLSGKLQIATKYTLASGHTASFTYAMQHSDTDGSYVDIEGASGVTSLTALDAGTAQRTVMELDVDLMGAKAFIRPRVTPVMSHSGTDVITVAGVLALGGGEDIPPTESTVDA